MVGIKKALKSVIKIDKRLSSNIELLEDMLKEKVSFEFGIEILEGDGVCIHKMKDFSVAPIDPCIKIIEDIGFLSEEDHEKLSI